MNFINDIITNFSNFFDWKVVSNTLSDPVSWGIILSLIVLEGLLSADNALVLAVMVKHLPSEQRKKALFYGIIGAYIFRFIAIGLGTYLVKLTLVKLAGAAYLLWIAYKGLFKGGDDDGVENKVYSFWKTVLLVELMDIAFSIDSVIAAFGISEQVWVLFLGGILGVLMMRGVAQLFIVLIEKYPELEKTAFLLIAVIALKMILGAFGHEVEQIYFFSVLIAMFLGTMIWSASRNKSNSDAIEK